MFWRFAHEQNSLKIGNCFSYHSVIQQDMGGDLSSFQENIVASSEVLNNEIHENSACRCERRCLKYNGYFYYIFYRKCSCGKYNNRFVPAEGSELPAGDIQKEGIDIHGNEHCRYVYPSVRGWQKKFVLHCHCGKF